MNPIRALELGAVRLLKNCLGLRSKESLHVCYDSSRQKEGEAVAQAGRILGATVWTSVLKPGSKSIPLSVSAVMKVSSANVLCVAEDQTIIFGHSDARARACAAGSRVAFLVGDLATVPEKHDLDAILKRTAKVAAMLQRSEAVRVLSGGGSSILSLRLAKTRKPVPLSSVIDSPGSWGAVPDYAEVAVAPLEEESEGKFFVDGPVVGVGVPDKPMRLSFKSGRIERVEGGGFSAQLNKVVSSDHGAKVLCELGMGMSHLSRTTSGSFTDKRILGSVHIGLGLNKNIGGSNVSRVHIDCLAMKAKVLLDGRELNLSAL